MAFDNFRTALLAHAEIENYLGVAGCYGYMGRAAKVGGDHPRAVILIEEAIVIYRRITAAWSEGIVMGWQGESFFQLELGDAAMAAMWQARELMRASGNPQAQQFDELFAQFAQSGDEARTLLDALPTEAETIRQKAIAAVKEFVESQTKEETNE